MLADNLPPALTPHQLGSVAFGFLPTILVVGISGLYLWGVWRVNRLQPRHRWSAWRTTWFLLGMLSVLIAVESFIGLYDDTLFWDHMVQHLLLIMVAAPLIALGCPLLLLWRATTGRAHERVTAALRSPVATFFDHPVVAYILYALVIPLSHLTGWYNFTLTNEIAHELEHVAFLVVGYLFWRQVVAHEPSAHRMHPGMRLAYLAFAIPIDTFTGLTLSEVNHEMFPAYVAQHRTWGPSLLQDLHLGGVIMWVGGDTLMFLAMIPAAIAWVRYEDRKAIRIDRELDAVMFG